ncbi:DMT family transporter [Tahibacter amnicola]|uniref:DMT family transporter n=1 Tax=Tahibacter amnicola TaxID=2976241 RepID=A0ABY6BGZ6_9GAMM|nr:DMT family transporter [Tahibacter amnicola]UXI67645.1 DMT family transporter [Tahibacter amnicola]
MNPVPRPALLAMVAGAALISTTGIFVKYAHVAPSVSAFYRMGFGGVMLLGILLAQGQWRSPTRRDLAWMAFPAVAFAVDLLLWHRSIRDVGPGLATLLGNFQVFVMALGGVWLYRERLGSPFLAGLALAFAGLWMLIGRNWSMVDAQYRLGVIYGILTGIAYAAYMLSFRHAQKEKLGASPAFLLCLNSLLCAGVLAVAIGVEGNSFAIPDLQSLGALLALALFGQVLGWLLIARAMPQLPASLVGLLLLLQPGLSFVLDVILFARPTVQWDWIGLVVSLAGIFVASAFTARRA